MSGLFGTRFCGVVLVVGKVEGKNGIVLRGAMDDGKHTMDRLYLDRFVFGGKGHLSQLCGLGLDYKFVGCVFLSKSIVEQRWFFSISKKFPPTRSNSMFM